MSNVQDSEDRVCFAEAFFTRIMRVRKEVIYLWKKEMKQS